MGFWDDIGDAVDSVGDAVSDVAESAYHTVASSSVGGAVAWAGNVVDTATFGLASETMNAADDYVFDSVDYLTDGAINIDYDDGQFTVGAGFEGYAYLGASVGEDGLDLRQDVFAAGGFDISMTDAGFAASGYAGLDFGPLPYAEGHMDLGANGDVNIGGRIQGTIPTPIGLLSGNAAGGFAENDQGWSTYVDGHGSLLTPGGMTIRGGLDFGYEQDAHGSQTSIGLEGSVTDPGLGTVGGSVGYDRVEHDGDVVEGVHFAGEVDAYGMSLHGEADYTHADIDGVEQSDWSGDYGFDGPSLSDAEHMLGSAAGSEFGGGDALSAAGVDAGPTDDFDSAINNADSIDSSMDDLMQGLQ